MINPVTQNNQCIHITAEPIDAHDLADIFLLFQERTSKLNLPVRNLKNKYVAANKTIANPNLQYYNFIKKCLLDVDYNIKKTIHVTIPSIVDKPISSREFKDLCTASLENILDQVANSIGIEILTHAFTDDLNFDCVKYAFYKLGHPKTAEWVSGKTDQNPLLQYRNLNEVIKGLGYFEVTDYQENDLIIYLDEKRKTKHYGVMADSKTVLSKWGKLPHIFAHPIETSPYGTNFRAFRKL